MKWNNNKNKNANKNENGNKIPCPGHTYGPKFTCKFLLFSFINSTPFPISVPFAFPVPFPLATDGVNPLPPITIGEHTKQRKPMMDK